VTGAAAGIGAAIAREYCMQGARVWLLDKDEPSLRQITEGLQRLNANVAMCVADITQLDQVDSAIVAIHAEVGCLDVLVNNAGVDTRRPFLHMNEAEWLAMLDVNLNGAYRCTRLVVPRMVERRAGKVIHISSVTFHWA
jgi:3-oxoacyl-[acyl-carrier protein] reductase